MSVELLTEHYLEILNLKGGCTGSSESTLVKMPHCWKSHVTAQLTRDVSFLSSSKADGILIWHSNALAFVTQRLIE